MLTEAQADVNYATHRPRYSDSSLYDEICQHCGAKDYAGGVDELSQRPCSFGLWNPPRRRDRRTEIAPMMKYPPLKADHPLIVDRERCARCHELFYAGDVTTLIPVPDGHSRNCPALPAHAGCIEELIRPASESSP